MSRGRIGTRAIYFQVSERYPLVVAANRDEYLSRAALPPALISGRPWVMSGIDLSAGGTWLGLNQHHLVASVLNRRTERPPEAGRRSRGLLCAEMLRQASVREATAALLADGQNYNPYNLLLASPTEAWVASNAVSPPALTPLEPGLHLITNLTLNDPTCPRIAKSYALFRAAMPLLEQDDLREFRRAMRRVLADHSTALDPRASDMPTNLCVHLGAYGTRCSTLVIYASERRQAQFWHADGPPCTADYHRIALPGDE